MRIVDHIAECAHTGTKHFDVRSMTEGKVSRLLCGAVTEMLSKRSNITAAMLAPNYELTVDTKPTFELKFFSPLQIVRCAENAPYEGLTNSEMIVCKDEINRFLQKDESPAENKRGMMEYYFNRDTINEKIVAAFFTAEETHGTLMGVLTCHAVDDLTAAELEEFRSWWSDYCLTLSDSLGRKEIATEQFGTIYALFGVNDVNWQVRTEEKLNDSIFADHHPIPWTADLYTASADCCRNLLVSK